MDKIRMLVIGHGISVFIFTVIVVLRYARILMKHPIIYRRDRRIPWHIISTALSYFLLTIFVCVSLLNRMGESLSWRVPLAICSFLLGNIGLFLMASYLKDEFEK